MNIIVHRGTKQIGGMVTEICTESTRIFIDMGSELPDENGVAREEREIFMRCCGERYGRDC